MCRWGEHHGSRRMWDLWRIWTISFLVVEPRRSRRLVSISVESRGGALQRGYVSCNPPVHTTTEFFNHSSLFLFFTYSSVSTNCGKACIPDVIFQVDDLSSCTPVRRTGRGNAGLAGRGGITIFKMSRGGTRCLFNHKRTKPIIQWETTKQHHRSTSAN